MSGLSRHMSLSVRLVKFIGSSVTTKCLRTALPGTRTLSYSSPTTEQMPYFQEHLNQVFSPLHFPKELAKRILTHGSHSSSVRGHNAGLSFIGRRVLSAYLQLFLHSSSVLQPSEDVEAIMKATLDTNYLGEHVGPEWGVGRVIRWMPSAPADKRADMHELADVRRQVGLYKVQGEAVEAIIGGIYFQFGGVVAQRVFHTRLLPLLMVKRGLPKIFHEKANELRKRMDDLPLNSTELTLGVKSP